MNNNFNKDTLHNMLLEKECSKFEHIRSLQNKYELINYEFGEVLEGRSLSNLLYIKDTIQTFIKEINDRTDIINDMRMVKEKMMFMLSHIDLMLKDKDDNI